MFEILRILHFLGLALGIGGGVAAAITGAMAASDPPLRPGFARLQRRLGRVSFGGLVLLWLTGVWMVAGLYDGWGNLPDLFWWKFAAVLGLTLCAGTVQVLALRAQRRGTPPPAARMKRLSMAGLAFSLAALVLAVLAFTAAE